MGVFHGVKKSVMPVDAAAEEVTVFQNPSPGRTLLQGGGAATVMAAVRAAAPSTLVGEPAPRVAWKVSSARSLPPPSEAVHVLNRITFGPRPGELEHIDRLGTEAFIDEQLHPDALDDSEVDQVVAERFPTLSLEIGDLLETDLRQAAQELKAASVYRALFSRRQLYEVLVDFWSNHFNIFHGDGPVAWMKTVDDRDVIRRHALGRFGELLLASARSPAMLVYLDNAASTKEGPNENYARELLELHTLGVDGGYSQGDVEEVARCFTGWTVARRGTSRGRFAFWPPLHDYRPKVVLGQRFPAGRGVREGERVVEMLSGHPSTARFIASKLCRRFVADQPPPDLVEAAANTFSATDGDIREVVRTVLTSKQFLSSSDQKLKRPLELLTSAVRALEAEVDEEAARPLLYVLRLLGQLPFDWHSPDGFPDQGIEWANTNGMLNRWNLGVALGANRLPGVRANLAGQVREVSPPTPAALTDAFTGSLLHRSLHPQDRQALIDYTAGGGDPNRRLRPDQLRRKVPGLIALLLDSPYFQWR